MSRETKAEPEAGELLGEDEGIEAVRRALNERNLLYANLKATQERCSELLLENRDLRARVRALEEAVVWMSGSSDFAPEGQARVGFEKLVSPLLSKLSSTP